MNVTSTANRSASNASSLAWPFRHAGIPYDVVDLTTSPAALEYVQDLGYCQAPVVVVNDHHHWSGFKPTEIERLRNIVNQVT